MKDQYCDICGQKPAMIMIEGVGSFCLDCHNARELTLLGKKASFDYPRKIVVTDFAGVWHTFSIEHMILGDRIVWNAYEEDGNYHFSMISHVAAYSESTTNRFFQKIIDGVCTKTIEEHDFPANNLLYKDDKVLSFKNKGTINILGAEDGGLEFEADGMIFSAEEFVRLFGGFEGASMQYQIQDISAPILREKEYLVPVYISKESLVDRLEEIINICGDSGFISEKDVMVIDEMIYPLIEKLEILNERGDKEEALATGKEMIRMLLEVETDDDYFPVYFLEHIQRAVDPYGLDEELRELMKGIE